MGFTYSRFGDGSTGVFQPGIDNTDRVIANQIINPTWTGGTMAIKPNAARTLMKYSPLGANTLSVATGPAYLGDKLDIMFLGDATQRTMTYGNGFSPVSSTQVVALTKTSTASFVFDGTAWVETGRSQGV